MKIFKTLFALSLVVFIPFGIMIWFRNHQTSSFASVELILYPLLFGGSSILVIHLLKRYFLKESLTDFNSGSGSIGSDVLWGFALTLIYFALFFLERLTLSNWLTHKPNLELLNLMLDMRENPLLLVLWFGPVLWIGIALYEELIRVFLLSALWKFSDKKTWTIMVILITSTIVGLAHGYQGSYGIVTIGIKSLVSCYYFYRYRRLFPLILAHVLYDGLQVGILLITFPK